MRGEVCVSVASFLAFVSMLLMIFVHVGQINTSTVPRGIYMAKVNMSGFGDSLQRAIIDPVDGLYTTNASAPLQKSAGLRQFYKFGLYSHCGYIADKEGICGNETIGEQFKPYDAITSDMIANYTRLVDALIPTSIAFRDTTYLGHSSKAAYWMLLLGSICAALALFLGIAKNNFTFFISSFFAIIGSLLLLIGAAIWTVIIKKSEGISSIPILDDIPMGIIVSIGPGIYLTWAAFACLLVSVVPYMVSCCTYRG